MLPGNTKVRFVAHARNATPTHPASLQRLMLTQTPTTISHKCHGCKARVRACRHTILQQQVFAVFPTSEDMRSQRKTHAPCTYSKRLMTRSMMFRMMPNLQLQMDVVLNSRSHAQALGQCLRLPLRRLARARVFPHVSITPLQTAQATGPGVLGVSSSTLHLILLPASPGWNYASIFHPSARLRLILPHLSAFVFCCFFLRFPAPPTPHPTTR